MCDVKGLVLKQVQTVLTLWTLKCVSPRLCIAARTLQRSGVQTNISAHVCNCTSEIERVCVHSLSPGLCFSCHVSPIGHSLYLERSAQPKQHGRLFRETWAWKEVNVWTEMCCQQDNKNPTRGNVSGGRGGPTGAETTSQCNPNYFCVKSHTLNVRITVCNSHLLTSVIFRVMQPSQKLTKVHKMMRK